MVTMVKYNEAPMYGPVCLITALLFKYALLWIRMSTVRQIISFNLTHSTKCGPVAAQRLLKWEVENILASCLTCADCKQAYKSWPELSQQMDIWVCLHLRVQRT